MQNLKSWKVTTNVSLTAEDINVPVVHQIVKATLAGRRQGNACTKKELMLAVVVLSHLSKKVQVVLDKVQQDRLLWLAVELFTVQSQETMSKKLIRK